MTLNITVLTPQQIYQSADYRLVDPKSPTRSSRNSTKVVTVSGLTWTGFLTYTGVGSIGGRETSEFVAEWLRDPRGQAYEDVLRTVVRAGSEWLRRFAPGTPHTFVLAAFVDGEATCSIISNFQRWHGANLNNVLDQLEPSTVRASRQAEVIVTGQTQLVDRKDRRLLARFAQRHAADPARVRRAIADLNQRAALAGPKVVSSDCFVYSHDRFGRGQQEAFGETPARPRSIMNGIDMLSLIKPLLDEQFGSNQWSIRASTSADSGPKPKPPACEPILAVGDTGYRLVRLLEPEGRRGSPVAVNASGKIVGNAVPVWNGPSYPCIWTFGGDLRFLAHFGGLGGSARGVDELGNVVGYCEAEDRASRATIWNPDGLAFDLGGESGRHSSAWAINGSGEVVGSVSLHPTEGGQAHFRPAIWTARNEPRILEDLSCHWGEAVAINEHGLVAIRAYDNRNFRGWLWAGAGRFELGLPAPGEHGFMPATVTAADTVVGTSFGSGKARSIWSRMPNGSWNQIVPWDGRRHPETVNENLDVAGWELSGGYRTPWVKRNGARTVRLPFLKYHHNTPSQVSVSGTIVGSATADHCAHPVAWTPDP